MSAHAKLSPSSAARWKGCAGSVAATEHCGDNSSVFAREGTAAHTLGERALGFEKPCSFFIGELIAVGYTDEVGLERHQTFEITEEMADYVQVYVDQVNREPGELLLEERFDLSRVYGVPDQFGTGDAVKLDYENKRLYVGDLKYGQGVMVYAAHNDQMYSYGAGALMQYDLLCDWETITVAILQPRKNHYDEHTLTRAELEAWMVDTSFKAKLAISLIGESPEKIEESKTAGEKQCQWCPIKGSCVTLAAWTHAQVFDAFDNIEDDVVPKVVTEIDNELLGKLVSRADIIESTCKAWRAEGKMRLEAQQKIPGWKLVQGKKGRREWSNKVDAEAIMKDARIKVDVMYSKTLVTLPAAEKLFKKKKPKVWNKLVALLTQKDGAPAMAEENDARPALVVAEAAQFQDVTDDIGDLI